MHWLELFNSYFSRAGGMLAIFMSGVRRTPDSSASYMLNGIRILELAERAADLYKRKMLKVILSNPRLNGRTLEYDYEKPFSMFINVSDLEKWRERRDLNPRPPA
jgi:hypothetical protein